MRYKNEIINTLTITILVLFLRTINIFQIENILANPFIRILIIILFSFITIKIQHNINKNYQNHNVFYQNLDILKFASAILIIMLHLRPFIDSSNELDFVFNNIITRICVPIFFVITGYFVAIKEKSNPTYIDSYIKKTISLYLVWSIIYLIFLICVGIKYIPVITKFIFSLNIPIPVLIIGILIFSPIALTVAFLYTGIYYHLWYFPAIIFSLILLQKWKQNHKIKPLLIISFILLLFGATETYYGVFPSSIQKLLSCYYYIFFTTRNFLFFGLFYVVLGYFMGLKEKLYSKHCFPKLIISFFLLFFETFLLQDTDRLNSNILLSCIPLTYYLFISAIYLTNKLKLNFQFGVLSKYYYLIHPMIIFVLSLIFKNIFLYPYLNILLVLLITHVISILIIKIKSKNLIVHMNPFKSIDISIIFSSLRFPKN